MGLRIEWRCRTADTRNLRALGLVLCVGLAAGGLRIDPPAWAQTPTLQSQITQHEQKLADARAGMRKRDEAVELNTLGSLYRQVGKTQKSLDDYNQALSIEQRGGNRGAAALTMTEIGRVYTDLGQEQKALDLFNQVLPVWRELGSRRGEALTLNNIGRVYSDMAQEDKALDFLNQALPIWRETGGRNGEASTLDNIGKVYCDMSQGPLAVDYLNRALPIWREVGERGGEALTLNNLGRAYADIGQQQKSLESYKQALAIWRELGNRQGEASTLDNLGRVYTDLGLKQQALEYFNQALPIWREVGNRNGEALDLNDIGRVHADVRETEKALDFYNQALPIWREVRNRRGEATTLTNLGRAYFEQGQLNKALEIDYQTLPIWREVKESRGEALALSSIGRVYSQLGLPQRAFPNTLAALALAKSAGDPDMQGAIDTSMMMGFRKQNRLEEAIFFGVDAVNAYQQIRKNISGLDKDLQAVFAESRSFTYRQLAEMLVEADRLGEAEQVLDLLKEQELKDIVRGASQDAAAKVEPLRLTTAQKKALSNMGGEEKRALVLEEQSLEYANLLSEATRTAEEDAQMKTLSANLERGSVEVLASFAGTIYPDLERGMRGDREDADSNRDESTQSYLQNTLAKLGPGILGIRLLLGEDHAYAIVVTANTRRKFELKATSAEIRTKVFEVLESLQSPSSDPRVHLAELYLMVVAPMEGELKALETPAVVANGVPTLLWSLDGALRYLPMGAFYDGHRYMVERFNNVLFTLESYDHMTDTPRISGTKPNVLAMGLSKSYGGLPALPGVLPELESVVHDPGVPESHGLMEGKLLPNDQFTLAALKTELGAGGGFPVVHIASHFVEEAGSDEEPFLMLGGEDSGQANGYAWNLSAMENSSIAFRGTYLLTLSACSTAKDYKTRDGLEMDSLGMVAQQKDAEAVLATMWDVNDASTSRLMSDFYARWVGNPAAGKAEALRQAQLALLHSSATAAPNDRKERGPQLERDAGSLVWESKYAHPFYWAPFVLIGNYK